MDSVKTKVRRNNWGCEITQSTLIVLILKHLKKSGVKAGLSKREFQLYRAITHNNTNTAFCTIQTSHFTVLWNSPHPFPTMRFIPPYVHCNLVIERNKAKKDSHPVLRHTSRERRGVLYPRKNHHTVPSLPQQQYTGRGNLQIQSLVQEVSGRTRGGGVQAVSLERCFNLARALREIKFYQKNAGLCLPRLPFARIVKEIMADYSRVCRIQSSALAALQEATEHILITYFELW
jgi:Core histone H2A/H2B/H3/H4